MQTAKPSKKRRRRSGRAGFCQGSDVSVDDAEGMVYGTCFYYLSFFFHMGLIDVNAVQLG